MDSMKLLYLGQYFDEAQEMELLNVSKRGLSGAGNTVQRELMAGFLSNLDAEDVDFVTTVPAPMFPYNCSKPFFGKDMTEYVGRKKGLSIGFVNIPGLKEFGRYVSFYRRIISWCKRNPSNRAIFTYAMYTPIMRAMIKAKRKFPDIVNCLMVSDLPNELGIQSGRKGIMLRLEKKDGVRQLSLAGQFDCYVLMAEAMKDALQIGNKPYCIIEGIAPHRDLSVNAEQRSKCSGGKEIIFYAGLIKREYNFHLLLEAFHQIEDDQLELWLCGTGDMDDVIRKHAQHDKRIQFFGYLPKQKVRELQDRSTIVINPRGSGGTYTRFSFPSKTMDALAAGKPLLCYKLEGIPEEYNEFLFFIEEESSESIRKALLSLISTPPNERKKKIDAGQRFVHETKSAANQTKKIIDMVNSIFLRNK